MKAISLWQPWASLIAVGAKRFETRSFAPPIALIGSRIAIHAAKRKPDYDPALWAAMDKAFGTDSAALIKCGGLPLGAVVCTATLAAAILLGAETTFDGRAAAKIVRAIAPGKHPSGIATVVMTDAMGNYAPGRWAWLLEDVQRLDPAIPALGRQGFFDWESPR